jgi:hypothetical protein
MIPAVIKWVILNLVVECLIISSSEPVTYYQDVVIIACVVLEFIRSLAFYLDRLSVVG